MPHQWTAEDVRRWRLLTDAVGVVLRQTALRGLAFKGAVKQIGEGVKRTGRALFPTSDPMAWRTLATYRDLANRYVVNGEDWRAANTAALQRLHAAALDLVPGDDPPPPPPAAVAQRLPYKD